MDDKLKPITEQSVTEQLEEIKSSVKEKVSTAQVLDMIKENAFVVSLDGVDYKLVKPNSGDINMLYDAVASKKTDLLLNGTYLPVEVLKKKWKEKGIDLYELDKKIEDLVKEKQKIQYRLGKNLEEDLNDGSLDELSSTISEIDTKINAISNEQMMYLDIALETRIHLFQYSFLSFLMLHKNNGTAEEEKLVKAFDNYDEYCKLPSAFINKINMLTMLMMKDEIEKL